MVNKVFYILACIMMYAFIFLVESYSTHFYQFAVIGGLALIKGIFERGIITFLLANTAMIMGILTKSLIKFLGRAISEKLGKYLMHRYRFVRNNFIAALLWTYLTYDQVALWWDAKPVNFKVYLGIIFGPITLLIFTYVFIVEFIRVYVMRKAAESGFVKIFEAMTPRFMRGIGKKVDRQIIEIAHKNSEEEKV